MDVAVLAPIVTPNQSMWISDHNAIGTGVADTEKPDRPLCFQCATRASVPDLTRLKQTKCTFSKKECFMGLRRKNCFTISRLTGGAHRLAVRTAPFHGANRGSI